MPARAGRLGAVMDVVAEEVAWATLVVRAFVVIGYALQRVPRARTEVR
jgi:hypothetical protein